MAGKPILVVSAPNYLFRWDMSLEKVRGEGSSGGVRAWLPRHLSLVIDPKASEEKQDFWIKLNLFFVEGPAR